MNKDIFYKYIVLDAVLHIQYPDFHWIKIQFGVGTILFINWLVNLAFESKENG